MQISYSKDNQSFISEADENDDYKITSITDQNRTTIKILPKHPLVLKSAHITLRHAYAKDDLIYLNGFQSWTDSKEFRIHQRMKGINHLPKSLVHAYHFNAYGDYDFVKYQKGSLHGFTYSYIKGKKETFLIGSYNFRNAYLVIRHLPKENKIILESDVKDLAIDKEFVLFDYVMFTGSKDDVLKEYLSAFSSSKADRLKGYTSWYNHYQDINQDILLKDLEGINKDSYDLFQIDDGFETHVGDWLFPDEKKFPTGLLPLVERIHQKGLKAGIWLAPFVAEKDSRLFKEHPEFLYMEERKPVFAGCNWSHQAVLDFRKDCVKEYIRSVLMKYMNEFQFDFFKLDFLYAITLIKDRTRTRSQLMEEAMEFLRVVLKDRLILGCGVPLVNAFGNVDYCRIGPDVSLRFDDVFYMRFMHRERISTKVTILNTIYRSHLDGFVFLNDPDVYLLRDDNIHLNKRQKEAILFINHLCGSLFFTSDDVSSYDEEKKRLLKEARKLEEARLISIETEKRYVRLIFLLEGKEHKMIYDSKKGVLIHG